MTAASSPDLLLLSELGKFEPWQSPIPAPLLWQMALMPCLTMGWVSGQQEAQLTHLQILWNFLRCFLNWLNQTMFTFVYVFHITPLTRIWWWWPHCLPGPRRTFGAEQDRRVSREGSWLQHWWPWSLLVTWVIAGGIPGQHLNAPWIRLGMIHSPTETFGPQVALWRSSSPNPNRGGSFVKPTEKALETPYCGLTVLKRGL